MTPRQVQLIQQSFARIVPISEQAASLFYGRLFELAPDVRPLFKGDMAAQGRKLMATLGLAVNSLHQFDQLQPALRGLGRRHRSYGVTEAHYEVVAEALLWTLEQGLGSDFTSEMRQAWATVYSLLAATMKAAAAAPAHHDQPDGAAPWPPHERKGVP